MTATDYAYYHAALAGQKPKAFTDDPQCGFYRKRITEKTAGGATRTTGHEPVAIWRGDDGELVGLIGGREVSGDTLKAEWNWIADKAVPEAAWRAVAERGEPWHDEHRTAPPTKDERERAATPAIVADRRYDDQPAAGLIAADQIIAEIEKARKGVPQYATVESDEQGARAQDLRSTLTSLAGKLDKHREALVRPHVDAQRDINARYNPIIKAAKEDAAKVNRADEIWERTKREAQRRAEEEADRIRLQNEADAREAAAAGVTAPPPQPIPQANTPEPKDQVKGSTGRAAAVRTVFKAVIEDQDALYQAIKGNVALIELMQKIAQARVDAGIDTPGVAKVEDVKIR